MYCKNNLITDFDLIYDSLFTKSVFNILPKIYK